jgi:hypothetical protein
VHVILDANADGYSWSHTAGYKRYDGVAGAKEWLTFLTSIDFPDFQVVRMVPAGPHAVSVTVSYTPTVKATGRSAPQKLVDKQEWAVMDGQVQSVDFLWSKPAVLDALFEAKAKAAAPPKPCGMGKPPPLRRQAGADSDIPKQIRRARKKFDALDEDGNGKLNGDELLELAKWLFGSFHPGVYITRRARTHARTHARGHRRGHKRTNACAAECARARMMCGGDD